jgi:hypothetical protein
MIISNFLTKLPTIITVNIAAIFEQSLLTLWIRP